MAYIMNGNPKDDGSIEGTNAYKARFESENAIVIQPGEEFDPMTGTINASGTKIINRKGNWISTDSVKGKQLKAKYARTSYADDPNTPTGGLTNKSVQIIRL